MRMFCVPDFTFFHFFSCLQRGGIGTCAVYGGRGVTHECARDIELAADRTATAATASKCLYALFSTEMAQKPAQILPS